MASGFRVPRLPRFGAPQPEPPRKVHVRATSVHGVPIELHVSPRAAEFTRSASFAFEAPRRPASLAAFARALDPTSDGLTVEVEAFCAPAAHVVAPNAGFLPKVTTPNPLPDGVVAPGKAAPSPAPVAPSAPVAPGAPAGPPPTLEELAALAELRELAGAPAPAPSEAPFPPPPAGTRKTTAPAKPAPPPPGASFSYGHEVFDRMAPPMAMTFDVGNVALSRRFSEMDSRLDRESARHARSPKAPNGRSASIDDHSLAQDLASMRWSTATHHAAASAEVLPGPAPAVPDAPVVKGAPAVDAPTPKPAPVKDATPAAPAPSPTATAQVVDVAGLIAGDVIVACDPPKNGAAPVTHTLLFIGDGQAVETGTTGMQVRPVAQVVAAFDCAIALRNNPAAWSSSSQPTTPVLVYVGHLKTSAPR